MDGHGKKDDDKQRSITYLAGFVHADRKILLVDLTQHFLALMILEEGCPFP